MEITCQICGKEIKSDEPVFGSAGNFFCAHCFRPKQKDLISTKKDQANSKAKWKELSKKSSDSIMSKVKGSNYYN